MAMIWWWWMMIMAIAMTMVIVILTGGDDGDASRDGDGMGKNCAHAESSLWLKANSLFCCCSNCHWMVFSALNDAGYLIWKHNGTERVTELCCWWVVPPTTSVAWFTFLVTAQGKRIWNFALPRLNLWDTAVKASFWMRLGTAYRKGGRESTSYVSPSPVRTSAFQRQTFSGTSRRFSQSCTSNRPPWTLCLIYTSMSPCCLQCHNVGMDGDSEWNENLKYSNLGFPISQFATSRFKNYNFSSDHIKSCQIASYQAISGQIRSCGRIKSYQIIS